MHLVCVNTLKTKNVFSDRLNMTRVKLLSLGNWTLSSMLIYQRMRKPFTLRLTALDVVRRTALSPLNTGDCISQLQIQVIIDQSYTLVKALIDVDAELELDAV